MCCRVLTSWRFLVRKVLTSYWWTWWLPNENDRHIPFLLLFFFLVLFLAFSPSRTSHSRFTHSVIAWTSAVFLQVFRNKKAWLFPLHSAIQLRYSSFSSHNRLNFLFLIITDRFVDFTRVKVTRAWRSFGGSPIAHAHTEADYWIVSLPL